MVDFVEKFHQVFKRLDYLVARMSAKSFRQQEMVKIRRQWLTSNPLVCNHIDSVNMQRKRNINDLPNIQRTKKLSAIKQERKRVKREKTERKQYHIDEVWFRVLYCVFNKITHQLQKCNDHLYTNKVLIFLSKRVHLLTWLSYIGIADFLLVILV